MRACSLFFFFPLPLWETGGSNREAISRRVMGFANTVPSGDTPHPALRATFSHRGEGKRTPIRPPDCRARSPFACRTRPGAAPVLPAHLRDVVVVELPGGILAPAQRRLHRGARGRRPSPADAAPVPASAACEAISCGLPAELPSGKSENRKRGTAACSTMSLRASHHHGRDAVGFEMARDQATIWWQTGQFGTSTATSTSSAGRRRGSPAHRSRS